MKQKLKAERLDRLRERIRPKKRWQMLYRVDVVNMATGGITHSGLFHLKPGKSEEFTCRSGGIFKEHFSVRLTYAG